MFNQYNTEIKTCLRSILDIEHSFIDAVSYEHSNNNHITCLYSLQIVKRGMSQRSNLPPSLISFACLLSPFDSFKQTSTYLLPYEWKSSTSLKLFPSIQPRLFSSTSSLPWSVTPLSVKVRNEYKKISTNILYNIYYYISEALTSTG